MMRHFSAISLPVLPPDSARHGRDCADGFGSDPADWHVFADGDAAYVFVTDGSRVYALSSVAAGLLTSADAWPGDAAELLARLNIPPTREPMSLASLNPPLRSLSLAVAQRCNLGCTYCYAQGGDFGGDEREMPLPVATAAIDRLFAGAPPGQRVQIAFMGGEPLTNRDVIRAATAHAVGRAADAGVSVDFAITTNATLLNADDCDFFERHAFAVTASIDGVGDAHDRLRPYKGGRGSYDRVTRNLRPLLDRRRRAQVTARVTVTPDNLTLRQTLDSLIDFGFDSVGFSPMLASPTGRAQMDDGHLAAMLGQMIECGREFERRVAAGQSYPFTNAMTAVQEIHRGSRRPYPCGAGAGYMAVSSDGDLFACHRFVNDPAGVMGSAAAGVSAAHQRDWLDRRHVDRQQPCRTCWARYLCGGGCHHEVIHRGRPACDFIRGWLHFCLTLYARLLCSRPDLFAA